jgi:hypothetical protein
MQSQSVTFVVISITRRTTVSLPSIATVDTAGMSAEQLEDLLYAAIKNDLPLAFAWFSGLSLGVHHKEDPATPLAAQIKRVVADGMRHVLEKKLFGGKRIVFANCCDVIVGPPDGFSSVLFQFETQNGRLNYADC